MDDFTTGMNGISPIAVDGGQSGKQMPAEECRNLAINGWRRGTVEAGRVVQQITEEA
ncbi:MAG TPA: hypothetical protein VF427_05070 [Noviherbaspirillum sp.]